MVEISKGGSNTNAAILTDFFSRSTKAQAQRIHLHLNEHFLSLVVSFFPLLLARKASSVWR